ncbi:cell division protein FtsA [candidate division KSB1 bacterium]|nr:cell division protein FtsA [candidate division KSB1 bacterium]
MKKSASHRDLICGVDIGTTKVLTVVAEPGEREALHILGVGCVPSRGLRRGVVINLEQTTEDIEKSVELAEADSGERIHTVWVGVAGEHVRSLNSRGAIPVSRSRGSQTGEVTSPDVERVVEAASAVALPLDRRVLHVIPQEFVVDSERGIRSPVGMAGVRLEANVHIVTCALSSAQNILTCCKRADLNVMDLVLEPLASATSVLTRDEMELGAILLDIGGGTTDLAVFHNGTIRHSAVVGYGGDYITRDIAVGLRTPVESAETIKIEQGAAHARAISQNEFLEIPGVGGREPRALSRSMLLGIIAPRVEEILTLAREELQRARMLEHAAAGVILTGGGASMAGMAELAEEIFALPVRIGAPRDLPAHDSIHIGPKYSTALGLIRYALTRVEREPLAMANGRKWSNAASGRVREWLQGIF